MCGPALATGHAGIFWCNRVASIATSAIPSNNAAILPVAISATARGVSAAQSAADDSDFSTVLAQTNAAGAPPPKMSDPLARSHTAPAKLVAAASSTASANAAGAKPTSPNISVTMPKIADPRRAATVQPPNPSSPKSSSVNSKKPSSSSQSGSAQKQVASSTTVMAKMQTGSALYEPKSPMLCQNSGGSEASGAAQKQDASAAPMMDRTQAGPSYYEPTNPMPAQNDGTSGVTGTSPGIVPPDPGLVVNQNAVDAPTGSQTSKSSTADSSDPEPAAETLAALQDALLDTLASGAPTPTADPTPKIVATSQPAGKTSSATQLNALMQSLQPTAHRETSAPAAQAQTPASQSGANQAAQPASAQNQGSDSNNSNGDHSHAEQTRNATDGSSPQSTQQSPDSANAAVTPPPSAAPNSGTIANPVADNTGGISAAVAAQNLGTSSTTLHVAPASQANVQAAPPDLNALAINIAAKSQAGAKQFDISLEPAELGRVEVRLTVDNAGNAQAHLVAERPETLQMLQRDSGTLSHALKESGVQLGDNGLQFSLKGQERQGDGAQQGASRARPLALSAVTSAQNILPISSSYGLAFSQAGVDIRV